MRNNRIEVLGLSEHGFRVIPLHTVDSGMCDCGRKGCASPAKHPRITDWPKQATSNYDTVNAWWRQWPLANVGIATGEEAGLVVIDVDPRNGGDQTMLAWGAEHGDLPYGPVVTTGGGGWHYYFKHPGGRVLSRTIAPGIDVKGDGGQVVAPPSYHRSGIQYAWKVDCYEADLPALPNWLLVMVKGSVERQFEKAKALPSVIPVGQRREWLLSIGGSMRHRGFGQDAIFAALMAENTERCVEPLDRTEVAALAADITHRYEPQEGITIGGKNGAVPASGKSDGKRHVEPRTVTLRQLQQEILPAPRMAVPGLMPIGLALLAGRLKMGKSWMMLGVGLAVAEGGIALGQIPVEEGDVLYIAYEDHRRRLQNRVKTLVEGVWPERMETAPSGCWPQRDDGGLEAIDSWLGEHPDARMVVIDTLQRFRGGSAGDSDKNAYAADYQVSAELQELAMRHEVVIVAVHHYRKSLSETDWVDQISGTNGIAGAADTIMGFERKRGEDVAILNVTGRDIDEQELALAFDPKKYGWFISGTADEQRLSQEAQDFNSALLKIGKGEAVHFHKIAEVLDKRRNTIVKMAGRLADKGLVASYGNGLYGPPSGAVTAVTTDTSPNLTGPKSPPVTSQSTLEDASDSVTASDSSVTGSLSDSARSYGDSGDSKSPAPLSPRGAPADSCPKCGKWRWTWRVGSRWLCEICQPAVVPIRRADA